MVKVCVLEIDSAGFPKVIDDNRVHRNYFICFLYDKNKIAQKRRKKKK